jgi:ABC-type polar amino acid transport system ATPase subunit
LIKITDVHKSFGETKVLDSIKLEVPKSSVYAVIGPGGAGKSTLIRTVNALEEIDTGEFIVDGVSIHEKKTDINKARTDIGFVFQS